MSPVPTPAPLVPGGKQISLVWLPWRDATEEERRCAVKQIMRFWMVLALSAGDGGVRTQGTLLSIRMRVFVRVLFDWSRLPEADPRMYVWPVLPRKKEAMAGAVQFTGWEGGTVQLSPAITGSSANGDMESTHAVTRNLTTRSIRRLRACWLR